ncbi:MAG: preprotein translocase subunit SecA [Candidatus Omnitrophica bacterium]|nr:preprotein translocase subunit SecA [Candidatus Omnitrophota bacterium]
MLGFVMKKIFGTQNERMLKRLHPTVDAVNALEPQIQSLSDDALKAKTAEFRARLAEGQTVDDILPESFAVVREVGKRVLNMRHFDVQIMGGLVLHQGRIAEMATGEGKTLVATLPVYLNALAGKGVHVVTVNDYLARRDRNWMGPVYEFLGLTIGVIQHDMDPRDRQAAYRCDITYGTNNEFGFDYLRDNMVIDSHQCAQRDLHYAIVDEVDSILVDEARTPLIISGPAEESTDKYYQLEKFIQRIKCKKITDKEMIEAKNQGTNYEEGYDALIDEKHRNIWFTEQGEKKFEDHFHLTPDDPRYIDLKHHRDQASKARELFKVDVDYVIKDNQVIIVDEFTGRLMPGRRFSDGLHQALEAKEGVKIERENQTLATVTFQNYFRMYTKLAGMTGTAETEAVEFEKIYHLDVMVMPPNKTLIRNNQPDVIYKTEREKFNAVADEIIEAHKAGRPVLVGTISIDKSERLSAMLNKRGIPHSVLNAKYHEREAEIISQAGQDGAITISTNMAGRGTDIVLGAGVAERGGLHVVATERHEARRIDNQLRGRSGRQGDPGSSRFFLSLEDDLMRIFGGDKLFALMDRLGMEEGQDIQHPFVTKAIETAQKRVETRNFEIRKHLLEYDDVMNRQREIVYKERRQVLEGENLKKHVGEIIEDVVEGIILTYVNPDLREEDKDAQALFTYLNNKFSVNFDDLQRQVLSVEELKDEVVSRLKKRYEEKGKQLGEELLLYMQKSILLQIIDAKWKEHLRNLDSLREGIGLRAYGQRNPLVEYQHEAFGLFDEMIESIKDEAVEFIFRLDIQAKGPMTSVLQSERQQYLHPEHAGALPPTERDAPRAVPHRGAPKQPPAERTDPIQRSTPKVGRNEPCPCGSGKKYKKCCGT